MRGCHGVQCFRTLQRGCSRRDRNSQACRWCCRPRRSRHPHRLRSRRGPWLPPARPSSPPLPSRASGGRPSGRRRLTCCCCAWRTTGGRSARVAAAGHPGHPLPSRTPTLSRLDHAMLPRAGTVRIPPNWPRPCQPLSRRHPQGAPPKTAARAATDVTAAATSRSAAPLTRRQHVALGLTRCRRLLASLSASRTRCRRRLRWHQGASPSHLPCQRNAGNAARLCGLRKGAWRQVAAKEEQRKHWRCEAASAAAALRHRPTGRLPRQAPIPPCCGSCGGTVAAVEAAVPPWRRQRALGAFRCPVQPPPL